jgi:uncharacterized protein (TIGR03000 family)
MKFVSLFSAALVLTLLAGAAAAQTEPADKELVKLRAELAATQKTLAETRQTLAKSQTDQADAQAKLAEIIKTDKTLRQELAAEKAEHGKAVAKDHAKLAEVIKTAEMVRQKLEAENARLISAAADLDLVTKAAARTKAELVVAQKNLTDAKQAKMQKELATNQKTLAETRTAAEEMHKSLEAEIRNSVGRLEEANRETDVIRMESKTAAAKLVQTDKDEARTKAQLNAAQKTLALQPPLEVTIGVTLPDDAKLTVDDRPTTSTGGHRVFSSPPISVGSTYFYLLKADVMREGKLVTMRKKIEFRAGDRIEVTLKLPVALSIGQP